MMMDGMKKCIECGKMFIPLAAAGHTLCSFACLTKLAKKRGMHGT